MSFESRPGVPLLRGPRQQTRRPPGSRGDALAGGCLGLVALFAEIVFAFLLALMLGLRGMERSREAEVPYGVAVPPLSMDWVPVLWLGGFTLAVFATAGLFLRSGHPYAGSVQLVIGAMALVAVIAAGVEGHERVHPDSLPPCPTRAGVPCAPQDPTPAPDRGSTGHQCRSGGDSDECADSGG